MLSIQESDPSAQISDTAIKGTFLSLLIGGYDTTMVTLTWAVSLLLNNRHVLRKVQDELEKHVGRDRQVLHLTLAQLLHGFELGTVLDKPIDITEAAPPNFLRSSPCFSGVAAAAHPHPSALFSPTNTPFMRSRRRWSSVNSDVFSDHMCIVSRVTKEYSRLTFLIQ
ncbi:hypothetical protein POM88_016992 [Heracleum sosnowskyi]|uniref:Cytochrome P450 n=1 Tax=Heracleum sosnowskyi TaxID=360622 RepID=A0AAD8IPP1_9APIA|nr:hypothetical protein POM88_016992 [Heracleum sosnowskyi]